MAGPVTGLPQSAFDALIGTTVDQASAERVVLRLSVSDRHLQPAGLVHGGVYASLAETAASIGASLSAMTRDPATVAVGVENHTSFLRRAGCGVELVVTATPAHAGRRTQVWEVRIVDAGGGRELARSTVRLMVVGRDEGLG